MQVQLFLTELKMYFLSQAKFQSANSQQIQWEQYGLTVSLTEAPGLESWVELQVRM